MAAREFDVVVFGATGDTGLLGCCCLYYYGKRLGIRKWAPAARNLQKLKTSVLDRFEGRQPGPDGLGLTGEPIKADSGDLASLVAMCKRTTCVIACAGPYDKFGEPVVRACVEAGTHYVDITGEAGWVEKMMQIYGNAAVSKGISMVSFAGYDSTPPDLTTSLAANYFDKQGDKLHRIDLFVSASGGTFPTGTTETVFDAISYMKAGWLRCLTLGLFGGSTKGKGNEGALLDADRPYPRDKTVKYVPVSEQSNMASNLKWSLYPGWSYLGRRFCLAHFMAPVNVNSVHHTAAHSGYGGLVYRERHGLPHGCCSLFGLVPTLMGVGTMCLFAFLVPLPGFVWAMRKLRDHLNAGPQMAVRVGAFEGFKENGTVRVQGIGVSKAGERVEVRLSAKYDAGLCYTMLSACTIGAALAKGDKPAKAGFNSPVRTFGCATLAELFRAQGIITQVTKA